MGKSQPQPIRNWGYFAFVMGCSILVNLLVSFLVYLADRDRWIIITGTSVPSVIALFMSIIVFSGMSPTHPRRMFTVSGWLLGLVIVDLIVYILLPSR